MPTPQHVGVDRLLAALAAARLREAERAIVIVDLGTAITVDLLTAEGVYAGGAILPGIELGARALQQGTHALPFVRFEGEEPPSPVGQVTAAAIQAGLYWGTVGAVSELITQIARGLNQLPDVMLTGGAATTLAAQLEPTTENQRPWRRIQCLPHLVLSGIALAHLQSQQQT